MKKRPSSRRRKDPQRDGRESIAVVVTAIVQRNEAIARFWSRAKGWAPEEAADLLSRARLDRQASLSRTLAMWIGPAVELDESTADGQLILAWVNLGALVEGTLKWFASVYYRDYCRDQNSIRDRDGLLLDPEEVTFDRLRAFFQKSVWTSSDHYDAWILEIQQRRNAIHSFRSRDIGGFKDFERGVRKYRTFLEDLDSRAPYPDEWYGG